MVRLLLAASCAAGCSLFVPLDDLSTDHGRGDAGTGDAPPGAGGGGGGPGAGPALLYEGLAEPVGLAVAGDTIYWVNRQPRAQGLFKAPKDRPGEPARLDEPGDIMDPTDVAADGTHAYWIDNGLRQVFRKPHAGGPRTSVMTASTGGRFLALEAGEIYFTDAGGRFGNVVSRVNLYAEMEALAGIAAWKGDGETWVFWARATSAQIVYGSSRGGMAPRFVVDTGGAPSGIAVDGASLFWIAGGRRLLRAPRLGGKVVTLHEAAEPFGEGDVAVDATHVYWSERLAGRIRRMAK